MAPPFVGKRIEAGRALASRHRLSLGRLATDGFVTKLSSVGTLVYNKQFGGTGNEVATAITLSGAGDVLVAGTADGNGFLRKFTNTATDDPPLFNVDLGSLGTGGDITGVATNSAGEIFVSGVTTNTALDDTVVQAHSGALDGFVMRITDAQITAGTPLAIADSVPITINAVNDPPTIANPGAQIVAQNTNLTVNGISIADVDVAAGNLEVTVAVNDGRITLAQTTGLTFSVGNGTPDATATFQVSLADINAAINDLFYSSSNFFDGDANTATINVSDLGNNGAGGTLTDRNHYDCRCRERRAGPHGAGSSGGDRRHLTRRERRQRPRQYRRLRRRRHRQRHGRHHRERRE